MKSWIIAALAICTMGAVAWADGMYWVVGNRATNGCDIVTQNPVIDGDIWFGTGPYKSLDDARLARAGIGQCNAAGSASQ